MALARVEPYEDPLTEEDALIDEEKLATVLMLDKEDCAWARTAIAAHRRTNRKGR